MSERARKPDIREQIGVAVNTSALTFAQDGHERALDRVAALGAASLAVQTGADLENVPIAGSVSEVYGAPIELRDQLASELGPMLWHIRFGSQDDLIPKAVLLLARWLRLRPLFSAPEIDAQRLARFATRVLHEWLSDRCIPCGGSGKLERTRSGVWIRPRGSMQRNAVFGVCTTCKGTRHARPSHGDRARWLILPISEYDNGRWRQRFSAALVWLKFFHVDRLKRPLTAQLERGKKHS